MSRFSGKCDCYDSLIAINQYTEEELINNVTIYVGDNVNPLKITRKEDLIPYYPYIISTACFNNKERKSIIHLSSESYVDIEERELLKWNLESVLKYYRKCKRKKIEFDEDDFFSTYGFCADINTMKKLIKRVKENGKKATFEGLHLQHKDYYRQQLVDEMIVNGLNPADYGYERLTNIESNKR